MPASTSQTSIKKVRFSNKNIPISPRKLRLVVDSMRQLDPPQALINLRFAPQKGARLLIKCLETVIADAKNNFHLNPITLSFDSLRVDEGPKIKRMDKSHGSRFNRGIIQKRHSRLEIILSGETQQ